MKVMLFALSCASSLIITSPVWAQQAVPVPHFESIGLNGMGTVNVRHGTQQQVVIREGSADVTSIRVKNGNSLEIDACRNECPDNYRLTVDIVTPELGDLAISGSGRMTVSGGFAAAGSRALAVNGSGIIDANALSAARTDAAISGSGHIRAGSTSELQAAISGSGKISYRGNPQVQSAVSGSGVISAER